MDKGGVNKRGRVGRRRLYRTKKRVNRKTSLKMVAYDSEENRTRMRIRRMMGWNILDGRRGGKQGRGREKNKTI